MFSFDLPEEISAVNQLRIDTLSSLATAVLSGAESLAKLNLDTARAVLQDGSSRVGEALDAKTTEDALALQSQLLAPGLEKSLAYSRALLDIGLKTEKAFVEALGANAEQLCGLMCSLTAKAGKGSQTPDFDFAPMMKAVFDSANSTLESIAQASHDAIELAETNFATVGKTATRSSSRRRAAA